MRIPFLVVGDAPHRPTGLSRILTDIVEQAAIDPELAQLEIGVVGYQPWMDLPKCGMPVTTAAESQTGMKHPWKSWAFSDLSSWGRDAIATAYRSWFGDRPGILFSVWDPARCFPYLELDLPVKKWGYFAVDATNINGTLSGPPALAIKGYDRVLTYGPFGQTVLQTVASPANGGVEWLPHGFWPETFTRAMTPQERSWGIARLFPEGYDGQTMVVGCVATNQRRKDLGLFCQVIRDLRARDLLVRGWLHTDRLVSDHWSVPQLAADCGLVEDLIVTTQATDRELAILYSLCAATVAPGRGEGFGYPILESQACGVPVAHVRYAGGDDINALIGLPYEVLHAEGLYGLCRPIVDPRVMADRVAEWLTAMPPDTKAPILEHAMAPYAWSRLWPRWQQWILEGLR